MGEKMSRKNHEVIGGRLVRTDKRFSDLKKIQREKISGWLYDEYSKLYEKNGLPPDKRYTNKILDCVMEKIEAADIWLPLGTLERYYLGRRNHYRNRYEKSREEGKNV